jgi:hypothetical protein
MECREVRQFAEAFVSEQLLVETTQALISHMDCCPPCRGEIEGLRRLRASTRSAFEGAADLRARPEFAAALRSRLQAEPALRRPTSRTPRPRWLAIAASLLLVVTAGWGWREWSASSMLALLHAAVGDHRFCAVAFKLAERPISLEEAARRYGSFNSRLETVEPSTTTLPGGPLEVLERHSCVFGGRRFAHIVLRYRNELVSLLVSDEPRGTLLAGIPQNLSGLPATDGFHVASFGTARHVVFVVSSLNDDDVQEVARAMVGPVSGALTGA